MTTRRADDPSLDHETPSVAVRAEEWGNPWINVRDGQVITEHVRGPDALVLDFEREDIDALALTTGDFDEDGIDDLVSVYAGPRGGLGALHRGREKLVSSGKHPETLPKFADHPFHATATVFEIPVVPDFLGAGDFDNDGHLDLVAASRRSSRLHLLPGDGQGGFSPSEVTSLPGRVTALAAGEINRRDGLADLVVGVAGTDQAEVLVFEGPSGALRRAPEVFPLEAEASAFALGAMDASYEVDLAVAAGSAVYVIQGRDRKLSLDAARQTTVPPARVQRSAVGMPVADLVLGDFAGDRQEELAVLTDDGSLHLLDPVTGEQTDTRYDFAPSTLQRLRVSSFAKDDLALVSPEQRRIHLLHEQHFASVSTEGQRGASEQTWLPRPRPAPVTFDVDGVPTALQPMRLNEDALDDLVVLKQRGAGSTGTLAVSLTAPMAEFVVDSDALDDDADRGDGVCETEAGACTLRAAIQEANASEGTDKITFSVAAIEPVAGQINPTFTEAVTIDGTSMGRVELRGQFGGLKFASDVTDSAVRGMALGTLTGWSGLTITNNHVGVNAAGDGLLPGSGLNLFGDNNTVGGASESDRNVIATMKVQGAENVVQGNYIGTDPTGTVSLGDTRMGIDMGLGRDDNNSNLIGGTTPGAGNLISGNGDIGIKMGGVGHLVQGNLVGTDPTGTNALGNQRDNVQVSGEGHLIGGTALDAGNVIAASQEHGLRISSSTDNRVQGNRIGTDMNGVKALGNARSGIFTWTGSTVIGGTDPGAGNLISGNGMHGFESIGRDGGPHVIQGNYVGTDASGTVPLGNGESGIALGHELGSEVGGTDPDARNVIAFNGEDGVDVGSNSSTGNRIQGNAIFSNEGLGISHRVGSRVTDNDDGDGDDGFNNQQNYPELAVNDDGSIQVALNSMPSTDYEIEFFTNSECDPSGHGEGETSFDLVSVTTDGSGTHSFTKSFAVYAGQEFITATATDPDGNTSEFSNCVEVEPLPTFFVQVMQDSLNHTPQPIANTEFQLHKIDLSNPADPFTAVETQFSDEHGLLRLIGFNPGEPFFLRTRAHQVEAVKGGHEDVDDLMYDVWVDNLYVDNDGGLHPDTLATSASDTTRTFLGHTSLTFNLVASIEWAASDDYVAGLEFAFINANNFLYDVTNGQALLGKVAIYDDKRHWNEADIQIHASNIQWPQASQAGIRDDVGQLHMPPKHFGGDKDDNIQGMYQEDPLDPNAADNFRTIAHELGHYAFGFLDEYQNRDEMLVHPFTNFGFMDDQRGSDVMASEMSAFVTTGYRDTHHFQVLGQTCWELFRDVFRGTYGDVRAEIHTPQRRGLNVGDVIEGPNTSLANPDLSVGEMMDFAFHTSSFNNERVAYLVTDEETGQPVPGARVTIEKEGSNRWITQGKATRNGEIRLFGAEDGDKLLVARGERGQWKHRETLVTTSASKGQQQIVELRTVDGAFALLPEVTFDAAGALRYAVRAEEPFDAAPTLQVIQEGEAPAEQPLAEISEGYAGSVGVLAATEAVLRLNAEDRQGEPFFVPQHLSVFELSGGQSRWSPARDDAELFLDEAALDLERIAVLTSNFPIPQAGLPDSLDRVSPAYALRGFPASTPLQGRLKIYYDADSLLASVPDAVTVYRWDDGWTPVPTSVNPDSLFQTATARIEQAGVYAAFLDLTQTTMTGAESPDNNAVPGSSVLHQNYPNPFQRVTTITYEVEQSAPVRLRVFNVLGQAVATLTDEPHAPGTYAVHFDALGLSSGVYFYELQVGTHRETKSMLVLPSN